jgi:hypothetical protein
VSHPHPPSTRSVSHSTFSPGLILRCWSEHQRLENIHGAMLVAWTSSRIRTACGSPNDESRIVALLA